MRKVLVLAFSLALAALAGACWAAEGEAEGKKEAVKKLVAEIKSIESPQNYDRWGGRDSKATWIPVLVKNNTSMRVSGVRLILYAFDKQKKKLFKSDDVIHWASDHEAGRWDESDRSIKEKQIVRQLCMLPMGHFLGSKEFKEEHGDAKCFVIELYVGEELIDVDADPKNFFKNVVASQRSERLKEWEAIKGEWKD